jgi:hypothetical protein
MALFPKFQEATTHAKYTGVALGSTLSIPIKREKHLEQVLVFISGTVTTGAATGNADGIINILKRCTLTAGGRDYVNGVSGAGLIELDGMENGEVDYLTKYAIAAGSTITTTAFNSGAAFNVCYPINCVQPQIQEVAGNVLLIPMPGFNEDGTLTLQIASQAEMDVNGAPTFAVSAGLTVEVVFNWRQAPTGANGLPHAIWELNENEVVYSASQKDAFEFPALGSYTGLVVRGYTSTSARGDVTATGSMLELQFGSTTLRKAKFAQIVRENERSKTSLQGYFLNSPFFDFLTDGKGQVFGVNSVIDANPSAAGGTRFRLNYEVGGAYRLKFLTRRIYGDLTPLKQLPK